MHNDYQILMASDVKGDVQHQLSRLFVEAFYGLLKAFKKDEEHLVAAFSPFFNVRHFAVVLDRDEVVAMASLVAGDEASITLDRKHMVKILGVIKGNLAYAILKRELNTDNYPIEKTDDLRIIEYVATKRSHRGKRLAAKAIAYLVEQSDARKIVLEVADNNKQAMTLYERLGFKTIASRPMKHTKHTGIETFYYMELNRAKSCLMGVEQLSKPA